MICLIWCVSFSAAAFAPAIARLTTDVPFLSPFVCRAILGNSFAQSHLSPAEKAVGFFNKLTLRLSMLENMIEMYNIVENTKVVSKLASATVLILNSF